MDAVMVVLMVFSALTVVGLAVRRGWASSGRS
jgi:hypothetical protein